MRRSDSLATMAAIAAIFLLWSRDARAAMEDSKYAGDIVEGDAVFTVDPVPSDWDNNATPLPELSFEMPTRLSNEGAVAIATREGFSPTSYPDYKGRSIGFGHLIKTGETFDEPMTREKAMEVFLQDVVWAEGAVNRGVVAPLTQNQYDALVSFCFNVGMTAFLNSTLVHKLNQGDPTAVDEFGKDLHDGLVTRRAGEAEQFQS